jgi:hypothetical protein
MKINIICYKSRVINQFDELYPLKLSIGIQVLIGVLFLRNPFWYFFGFFIFYGLDMNDGGIPSMERRFMGFSPFRLV